MKKLKKVVALLAAAIMLAGAMAGCAGGAKDNGENNESGNNAPTSAADQKSGDGNTPTEEADPYTEKITFSMSVIGAETAGLTNDGQPAANFEWLKEKFNVEFDFWPLTWSNYIDQTRMWLNSDSAPDLIMLDIAPTRYGEYLEFVEAGLFKPYPDLANYENLKKRFDNMTTGKKFEVDGKIYAWPAYKDSAKYKYVNPLGYLYRRDWAKAVGLWKEDDIYTYDEWINLVDTVIKEDPGKNGAGKTIGIITGQAWGFPKFIVGSISPNMMTFTQDASGTWVWGPTLPESLEAVVEAKRLYDSGIIWSDQPMITPDDGKNNFAAGKLFAAANSNLTANGFNGSINNFANANPDINAEEAVGVAFVKGVDGKFLSWEGTDQWSQTAMNYNMSDEKAERWAAILDFLVSDDGYNFINYGIEDVDWEYDADGNAVCLWTTTNEAGNLVNPYGAGTQPWARPACAADGFALLNPAYPEWQRNIVIKASELYSGPEANVIPLNVEKEFFGSEAYANATAGLEAEIYTKIAELMTSDDIATEWTKWVNQKLAEVQPALDELNANLKY